MRTKIEVRANSIVVQIPSILAAQFEHLLFARGVPAGVSYRVGATTRKYSFDSRKHTVREIQATLEKANVTNVSVNNKAEAPDMRDQSIEATSLGSGMTHHALQRNSFTTLGELADKSELELGKMPGIGRKTLRHIKEVLKANRLSLSHED